MLCDQFDACLRHPALADRLRPEAMAIEHLGRQVAKAQRFVLERDAVTMVHNITVSRPSNFLAALSMCRMPFERIWVEFAFKDRYDWLQEVKATKGIRAIERDDATPPSRLGFYLEDLGDGKILVQPVWTHQPPLVNISFLALVIDTSADHTQRMSEEDATGLRERMERGDLTWDGGSRLSADEIRAAIALEDRIQAYEPPYMRPLWAMVRSSGDRQALNYMSEMARYDLGSEWKYVLALLTMLNSRNVVDYSAEISFDKLNKARQKKGELPLLSHRKITLSLTKVQKNRLKAAGVRGADMQSHLVRGHWKLRKTGIFWWSSHVRGSVGDVPETRTYRVVS